MTDRGGAPRRPAAPRDPTSPGPKRADVQALRAIAVSAVLIYHLWPNRLSGGYVGVDVFFVISGFLITTHLMTHPPRRVADLFEFWSRRIRRLLPAALLVLTATLVASRIVAPATQWANTALQARSAAWYVVNWRLAGDAVDYLAADNAPTPVQHYWSLSVEEQFYLFWPLLLAGLIVLAGVLHRRRTPVVLAGVAVLVAGSFWYSVRDTSAHPASAYFVTPARIWELGIGGLVAVAVASRPFGRHRPSGPSAGSVPRTILVWAGLAAIAWAIVTFDGSTPFPGWHALVPTLGCAAVIVAADPRSVGAPHRLFAAAPVQRLGDVSYSLYLWHWPLIVLLPAVSHRLGVLDKASIVVVSLVLAAATKRFVEDPLRTPRWGRPLVKPFALAVVGMLVVTGAADLQLREVDHREAAARTAVARAIADKGPCFGAPALTAGPASCPPVTSGTLTPDPLAAKDDRPVGFPGDNGTGAGGKNCFALQPSFAPVVCHFGSSTAKVHLALVGNSHAYEFLPALMTIAAARGWDITTYIAQRCVYGDLDQGDDIVMGSSADCRNWVHWVTRTVAAGSYDLVVTADRAAVGAAATSDSPSPKAYQAGYVRVLQALRAAHEPVVGIRDSPAPGVSIPDCLAEHTADYTKCDGTPARWLAADPLTAAIDQVDGAAGGSADIPVEADLSTHICTSTVCPAVIGGVPVYFDNSHLSATFAQTLAPYLDPVLRRVLG